MHARTLQAEVLGGPSRIDEDAGVAGWPAMGKQPPIASPPLPQRQPNHPRAGELKKKASETADRKKTEQRNPYNHSDLSMTMCG